MLKRTGSLQPKRKFGGSLLPASTSSRATTRIHHHVGCLFSSSSVTFNSTQGITSSSSSNTTNITTTPKRTTTTTNNNIQSINIGNINLYSSSQQESIEQELLIPNYSLFGEDVAQLDPQKDILSHLKWMAMKDKMKQDMFLIGHYGELKRHLAFTYCQLARRSVEYVCITKDTSEHDFKQRREIETGSAFYVDQAAVRAAKNGSVLILEGIEKADLNILPILNNLMENREMALESGTMLISPQRYKQLIEEEGKTPEELKLMKIEPVHEDFRIIAMGLPVPYYDGNTLDPPLRSRFNARVIDLPSMDSIFSSLVNHRSNDNVLSFLSNEQKKSLFLSLIQFTQSIVHLDNLLMNSKDGVNTNSKTGSIELLPRFPIDNLKNLIEMLNDYRSTFALSVENVESLIHTLYPFELFMSREKDKSEDEKLEQNKMIEIIKEQLKECSFKIHQIISQDFSPAETNDEKQVLITKLISQSKDTHFKDIGFVLIEKHQQVLTEMMRSHLCGKDMCLIGDKGSGKSLIAHAFASMAGYKAVVFPMYKEMTSKDLLQKRGTDSEGNTIWKNSVLIDSMIDGSLCILDGIDRMSTDILLSIQTLIQDRILYLFNGNRYISHEYYDKFLSQGFTKEELTSKGIYRIHEDFRIIATGLNDSLKWLSLELFNLFHFHIVPKLSIEEEVELLSSRVGADTSNQNLINSLIRIKNDYNNTEFNQDQRLISMRDLIRIVKRSMIFKDECLLTAIERTTMTYLLPKHHLELLRKLAIKYKVSHNQNSSTDRPVHIDKTDTHIIMDDIKAAINLNANLLLVPKPYFVQTEQHAIVMKAMLKDHLIGDHSLLIGYQGVGKNKITDQFLNLLQCEREYMQLHRDITIASLTVQPSVVDGVLTYIDSPLVKAVRHGRILVLDEIDKAPLEVVSILKSLVEDGNMVLGDGRTIVTMKEYQKRKQQNDPYLHKLLPIMEGFRIIALSNPPTFPFHGNSFYDASGDIFSNHYVSNPRGDSEIKLLQSYGPDVPLLIIKKLSGTFDDLRLAVEEGVIQYPYSTRELVHIVKHLQAFPNEVTLQDALANVFDFDSFDRETLEFLAKVFQKHEIPVSFNNIDQFSIRMAQEVPLVKTNEGKNICFLSNNPKLTSSCEIQNVPYFIRNYMSNQMYYDEPDSGAFATKNPADKYTNLMEFSELRYIINLPCNKTKGIVSLEDSVHIFSTSNPFGMIHFESNQCDSFKVTELYRIQSKLGPNLTFISLKNLKAVALFSAKLVRQDRFKNDNQSNFIETDVYALVYHPKLNKKFELEFSYTQFVQNSLHKDVRGLPIQFLTEFTDSHSMVGIYQSGSRTIQLIDMSSWDPSVPIKRGTPPHNSKTIHLPFNIDSVRWLAPNTFLVLEYGGVSNYWKVVELNGNSVEIKDVSDMSTISLKEYHVKSSGMENLLFAQPIFKENTPQEVFLRKIARKDDLLTIEADLSIQKGNPKLLNVQSKYLKKSNQLVLLHYDQDGLPTLDVLNFERNTYRRVTPPERKSKVAPSFDSSRSQFVDLSNGYIALLDEENKLLLFNLNVDKLAEEAISWKKFHNTSGTSSDSLKIEYIQQDKEANFPKHGKVDDLPHVGGNTFAGGSGGFDTAGLGGAGGPYRLYKEGNPIVQVSDEVKNNVSKEILERARAMAEQAYKKRLQEIDMTAHEMNLYSQYKNAVSQQIDQLRKTLAGLKWRDEEEERVWIKNQTTGEIDDNKIVEGIVGEKNIYKRRANENEKRKSNLPKKKKLLQFVVDVSGSMYRFNHQDQRLDKMLEIAVIIMESFKGFEDRYEYKITGHSGQTSCLDLVKKGSPPKDEKERLKVLLKMHAHAQYCWSGDTTVRAIRDASKNEENDFVFVFSDANLSRYGISHQDIATHLKKNTFIIFIASMFNEAQELKQGLPSSNSFVCLDTRELSTTFKKILSQNITMSKNK